jgi:hypothetical protein
VAGDVDIAAVAGLRGGGGFVRCLNCGYEHPVVRGALGDNEWWWMQCPMGVLREVHEEAEGEA